MTEVAIIMWRGAFARFNRVRQEEGGATVLEWALIAAVVVVAASIIAGVILKIVNNKADDPQPMRGRDQRLQVTRRPARLRLRRGRDERGVSALELSFLAPAFLLLIFFSIQAALYFYGRNVAIQSAREGVSQLRLAQDQASYESIKPGVVGNTQRFASTVGREALIDPKATPTYDERAGAPR